MIATPAVSTAATATPAANAAAGAANAETLVKRVDDARASADQLGDQAQAAVKEYREALEAFHAEALRVMIRRLKADARGKELLLELAEEPLVYASMLTLGVVKADLTTRVARAIERIRPYARSHGGDVEFVRVDGDTAFVRLHGACSGCSMSAQTLSEGVENAIRAVAPEITSVEQVKDRPVAGFIPLTIKAGDAAAPGNGTGTTIGVGMGTSAANAAWQSAGWVRGPMIAEVAESKPTRVMTDGSDVLVIRREGQVFAYRNVCPHQGMPLDDGMLSADGTLTCPWHGLEFDVCSGECKNEPMVQLEPLPVKIHESRVWIRANGAA
jgi:nitrite reductase/ring-hydroxylating ferredoxin subunit/Fe-S cluster biogenesis protein NfuA